MDQKDILDQLEVNVNRNSALETLMQVDAVLDSLNVYAFKNWMEGEIVDGPHIERYWVTVTVMYPAKKMPDPAGAERILKANGKVYFAKDHLVDVAKLETPDDIDPIDDPRRPDQPNVKKVRKPIWLVTLELPRSYIDSIETDKLQIDDMSIDIDDMEDAQDLGLGDEDAITN